MPSHVCARREAIVASGAIDRSAGLRPGVTGAAIATRRVGDRRSKFFPEISQQKLAPAGRDLGVMNHLLQLRAGDFAFLRVGFLVNEPHLLHAVAGAEQQQTFAGQAVAPRAAGFLVIAFDVFRQIVMNHEADVRLVDAHAERNGGADHARLVAEKRLLIGVNARRLPSPA